MTQKKCNYPSCWNPILCNYPSCWNPLPPAKFLTFSFLWQTFSEFYLNVNLTNMRHGIIRDLINYTFWMKVNIHFSCTELQCIEGGKEEGRLEI